MKYRNPFKVLLFSIITLGIYDLYWLESTRKALTKKTAIKVPSIWLLISPVIAFIAGMILIVVAAAQTIPSDNLLNDTYGTQVATTSPSGPAFVAGVILFYAGILAVFAISFYWFWRFSKAVSAYTKGEMSFPVAFLLLWVLHLIGVMFIQDQFNSHPDLAPASDSDMHSTAPHEHHPEDNPPAHHQA